MATAYHMVHYRKVVSIGAVPLGKTFEEACREALGQEDTSGIPLWSRVLDRIFTDPDGMQQQVVLNRVADLTSAVFGEMCLVDTRSMQALLAQKPSTVSLSQVTVAEIYDLHESEAPSGSQFVRGMAYWLAIGDHLFFVKTSSMSPRLIQRYFTWMLASHHSGYPSGSEFNLQAEFNKAVTSGNIGDIKAFRVKGGSAPQFTANIIEENAKQISTTKKVADRFVAFSQAVPIIRAILGDEKTKSLVESLGPLEYLSVDASVKVRGRRTEASKAKLKELTTGLDDLTDGTIQIEGRDGKISDGDAILRTTMPFDLVAEGASLLDFNNVADQLQLVYSRFVQDGMIGA